MVVPKCLFYSEIPLKDLEGGLVSWSHLVGGCDDNISSILQEIQVDVFKHLWVAMQQPGTPQWVLLEWWDNVIPLGHSNNLHFGLF